MDVIKINPARGTKAIDIGQAGENEATAIEFDLTAWIDDYGAGNVFIYHQREGDEAPYFKMLNISNKKATWTLDDVDTGAPGTGAAQLTYVVNDKVKKTIIFATYTNKSLGEAGEIPDPYEDLLAAAREILAATNTAAQQAASSAASAGANEVHSKEYMEAAADYADQAELYKDQASQVFTVVGDLSAVINPDRSVTFKITESEE